MDSFTIWIIGWLFTIGLLNKDNRWYIYILTYLCWPYLLGACLSDLLEKIQTPPDRLENKK